MSVDKNLFLYDLAVVAIFKDESPYLKEWLDYHLLAGVEHFYLYNNDSSDDYEKILAPYVEANLVTLINFHGRAMQMPAYDDALRNFKFFCRYMAFIDLDEFIFPQTNQSIAKIVDEIFSRDALTAGLAINWHIFGSNGEETADFSRGVLERFTRRAPDDWQGSNNEGDIWLISNVFVKPIVNPRKVAVMAGPHSALYFGNEITVDETGDRQTGYANSKIPEKKIVLNHYYLKSLEEFKTKQQRGFACFHDENKLRRTMIVFNACDRNEIFDDGILKYRAARAENFSLESHADRLRRVEKILVDTLIERSPFDAPADFFVDKLETFLTCRKLAEVTGTKIANRSAEEYALVWLHQNLVHVNAMTNAEIYQLMRALPEILARPFPLCKRINALFQSAVLPIIYENLKKAEQWGFFAEMKSVHQLLEIISG